MPPIRSTSTSMSTEQQHSLHRNISARHTPGSLSLSLGPSSPGDQRAARTEDEPHQLVPLTQFCHASGGDMVPSTSRFLVPSASLCHTLQLMVFIVKYLQPFSGQALPKKTHQHPQEKDTCRKSTKLLVLSAKRLLNRVVGW